MKSDPMDDVTVTAGRALPPSHGPGSGKAAWVDAALHLNDQAATMWSIIDDQSATIRELQAEVELLREQIAKRKPKGGRPPTDDKKVASIEADLARGYSRRQVASRCGVSAMTVTRIAQRIEAREKAAARS